VRGVRASPIGSASGFRPAPARYDAAGRRTHQGEGDGAERMVILTFKFGAPRRHYRNLPRGKGHSG
jgi:hypothetical protein